MGAAETAAALLQDQLVASVGGEGRAASGVHMWAACDCLPSAQYCLTMHEDGSRPRRLVENILDGLSAEDQGHLLSMQKPYLEKAARAKENLTAALGQRGLNASGAIKDAGARL